MLNEIIVKCLKDYHCFHEDSDTSTVIAFQNKTYSMKDNWIEVEDGYSLKNDEEYFEIRNAVYSKCKSMKFTDFKEMFHYDFCSIGNKLYGEAKYVTSCMSRTDISRDKTIVYESGGRYVQMLELIKQTAKAWTESAIEVRELKDKYKVIVTYYFNEEDKHRARVEKKFGAVTTCYLKSPLSH